MSDEFFVYDNWVRSKAIVHRGICSFCNNGNGLHGKRATKSSTWHGPYLVVADARSKAKSLRRDRTDDCQSCDP